MTRVRKTALRLWLFGLILFSITSQIQAAGSPVTGTAGYILGVGDVVRLTVYGQPDLATEAQIAADGMLAIPLLGSVEVIGRSPAEASRLIARQMEAGGYLQDAHVNLLVTEYRSQSVAVLGKVNKPGKLILEGPTTLTEALAQAGGIAPDGSERVILSRLDASGHQKRYQYDLQLWLDHQANDRPAVILQPGDTLYVPRNDRFYVRGEVQQPGMYTLDRPLNVMQALSMSGGFTGRASKNSLLLYRRQSDGSVKESKANLNDPVKDGDVLLVEESLF